MSDERGFTLIELVVGVMVLGIILGGVFGAIVLYLNTTTETTDRLSESPTLQILSSYFGADAQSAEAYTYPALCGRVTGTQIANFSWTDPGSTTGTRDNRTFAVSYVDRADPSNANQHQLVRYSCIGGVAGSPITVVSLLSPEQAPQRTLVRGVVGLSFDVCTARSDAPRCKSRALSATVEGERRNP